MRTIFLLLMPLALAGIARVSIETPDGPYELMFDAKKISRSSVADAIVYNPRMVPPGLDIVLEACDDKDKAYKPCGDGTLDSPNFLHNGEVNITKALEQYKKLKKTPVPKELVKIKEYFKRSGAFYIWLLKTRLEFYKTSKLYLLKGKFADLDAGKRCASSIQHIEEAKNRVEAYRLARTDWHNCVNEVYNKRYGKYPKEVWKAFLDKHGLTEPREEPVFQEPPGRK